MTTGWISDEERISLKSAGISILSSFPLSREALLEPPTRLNTRLGPNGQIELGAFSYMNGGHFELVTVGRYCSFAEEVLIGLHEHPTNWLSTSPVHYRPHMNEWNNWGKSIDVNSQRAAQPPVWQPIKPNVIGNDVWIGRRAIIRAGVTIGDGAIIAANSVVVKDVPPYAIVGGVPAKIIRYRFDEKTINKLLDLRWWEFPSWELHGVSFDKIEQAIFEIESRISHSSMSKWVPRKLAVGEIADFLKTARSSSELRDFLHS